MRCSRVCFLIHPVSSSWLCSGLVLRIKFQLVVQIWCSPMTWPREPEMDFISFFSDTNFFYLIVPSSTQRLWSCVHVHVYVHTGTHSHIYVDFCMCHASAILFKIYLRDKWDKEKDKMGQSPERMPNALFHNGIDKSQIHSEPPSTQS